MKILVYDIAAEDGGGLYVLNQFYNELIDETKKSISFAKEYEWYILTSLNSFTEYENIHILSHPEVKQSTKNRILFDTVIIKRILRDIKPDYIISLQNNLIFGTKIPQYVYLHQSLQYCPKKYSFLKKEERSTAFRQKIICGIYKFSLPKAKHIFVQTKWMKKATEQWLRCETEKISVIPMKIPSVPEQIDSQMPESNEVCFFYPARAESYKNHQVVIDASKWLLQKGIHNFRVLFTFEATTNEYARRLFNECKGLPIEFIGSVTYEQIWTYYRQCVLVFPSYMETIGLPMLEARAVGGRIIASDLPFSHEDLDGYPKAEFFIYNDVKQLAKMMRERISMGEDDTKRLEMTCYSAGSKQDSNIMLRILKRINNYGENQ